MAAAFQFQFSLKEHKFMEDIYKALEEDDASVVVITALQILRSKHAVPKVIPKRKCKSTSEECRKKGNEYLNSQRYQEAMEYYNEALMYAPTNSREMKLAYGNRSFILFKSNKFKACIVNIKLALAIETATDINERLCTRLEVAIKTQNRETVTGQEHLGELRFFKIAGEPNPDIPCASTEVGVLKKRKGFAIIANRNIKVGRVLAIEEAFSVALSNINDPNSCYYCAKKSLNLIPCDNCCCVLFCDVKCKENSFNEGHNIECQIMDIVDALLATTLPSLVIKATLKIRRMCKSWKEFVESSFCVGSERAKNSSLKEIYDVREKFSVLCFNDDRLFVHGAQANTCFGIATVLHYLETLKNYLPQDDIKKKEAMRALARVMMYLVVNRVPTSMYQAVTVDNSSPATRVLAQSVTFGLFPFLGKMQHSCTPNVVAINLNRKMVLIACTPIESGTQLTAHFLGAHVNPRNSANSPILYTLYGMVCNCIVCTGKVRYDRPLNSATSRKLAELSRQIRKISDKNITRLYPTLCDILTLLKDVPHKIEFDNAKGLFVKCLVLFANYECKNVLLDYTDKT